MDLRSFFAKGLRVFFLLLLITAFWMAFVVAPGQIVHARNGTERYNFMIEYTISNLSNWEALSVTGQLPVMAWKSLPSYQKIESVVSEPAVAWNKNGYQIGINLDKLPPRGIYRVKINYQIQHSLLFQDPPNLPAPADFGRAQSIFLQPEEGVEVGNPKLVSILRNLGIDGCTPKEKARKIFSYVNETLDYKVDLSRKADALVALKTGWGRCEDYAMLFTALCRTTGVPARLVTGFRLEPNEVRSYQPFLLGDRHMWAEVYLPSIGWISVDPTYLTTFRGQKVTDFRFFAGFYDDDIHVFLFYGSPLPEVQYKYFKKEEPDIQIDCKFYINRV